MMFWLDRHRRFRDQLSAYIDGALDPAAARRLEAHLGECEGCWAELEQLRSTVAALRELPEAQVPRSFALSPERVAVRRPAVPAAPAACTEPYGPPAASGAGDVEERQAAEPNVAETPAADDAAKFMCDASAAETPAAGPEEAKAPAAAPSGGGLDAL